MTFEDYIRLRDMPNRPESYFKYVTANVAKTILVNHKLRWSSPLLFNDPFDVKRDFDLGFDIEVLKQPLINELTNLLSAKNMPDLSSKPRIEWFVKLLRRKDRTNTCDVILSELPQLINEGIEHAKNNSYEMIKKQWSEFIPQFRILCLSTAHDSLLMWSHYSDSHKGVVLELQCIDCLDSPWLIAQPVTYQNTPPVLATEQDWIKSITGQKRLNYDKWQFYGPYTLTKTISWEYEKEWRVVSFMRSGESGLYTDYPFNPPELKSIYLGCDIPEEDANDIISLMKFDFSHVRLFRAKKIERDRKLSFDRIK